MEPKQYKLLAALELELLSEDVTTHLNQGWRLAGIHQTSMVLQTCHGHPMEGEFVTLFTQAVTK